MSGATLFGIAVTDQAALVRVLRKGLPRRKAKPAPRRREKPAVPMPLMTDSEIAALYARAGRDYGGSPPA